MSDPIAVVISPAAPITATVNTNQVGGAGGAGAASWGSISGTLSAQTDLQTALNNKQDAATAVTSNTAILYALIF
jgi:hypothetical protein